MSAKKERTAPANEHSERVVLGELLLNNAAWPQVKTLTEDDFFLVSNKRIFACLRSRLSIGRRIDYILLCDAMRRQNELEKVGGGAYIASLTEGIPRGVDIGSHAANLREKTRLRHLIQIARDASNSAYGGLEAADAAKTLAESLQRLPAQL